MRPRRPCAEPSLPRRIDARQLTMASSTGLTSSRDGSEQVEQWSDVMASLIRLTARCTDDRRPTELTTPMPSATIPLPLHSSPSLPLSRLDCTMERETPPPQPSASTIRANELDPLAVAAAANGSSLPSYMRHSANSGRLHNQLIRRLSLHIQAAGARVVLGQWNELRVYNRVSLLAAIRRPSNQALVTVSNHQSTMDDPALIAALTPYSVHTDPARARWGWCASELCFPTDFVGWFFRHGKIFPITRGMGLNQQGFREAEEHVADGDWMHIFPEGRCIPIPRGLGELRWGAGKLIADAWRRAERCQREKDEWSAANAAAQAAAAASAGATAPAAAAAAAAAAATPVPARFSEACPLPPLVLPMVHHGMTRVMPFYQSIPKRGHRVRAIFGEPVDVSDIIRQHELNTHNR